MKSDDTFYNNVVDVTYKYLGPAADRFVSRQIRNHLDKEPRLLNKKDLPTLIDWFRLTMAMLSDDTTMVDDYIANLKKLMSSN